MNRRIIFVDLLAIPKKKKKRRKQEENKKKEPQTFFGLFMVCIMCM